MKHSIIKVICLLSFMASYLMGFSQNIVIVSGTDYVTKITKEELKQLYEGDLSKINNQSVSFLDHERNMPIYIDFIKQYFNMTEDEMKQFWVDKKLESGKRAPKFLPEGFLPKALISIKGSVSYYYENEIPDGVHKVEVTN